MKTAARILMAALALSLTAAPALASGSAPAKKKLTDSEDFMEIPGLTATLTEHYHIIGMLQVDVGLDIPDAKLRHKAEALMPRLKDSYTTALTAYAGGFYQSGRVPDADRIAQMLQVATNRVLEDDGAHLLLGMVVVHD